MHSGCVDTLRVTPGGRSRLLPLTLWLRPAATPHQPPALLSAACGQPVPHPITTDGRVEARKAAALKDALLPGLESPSTGFLDPGEGAE